MRHYYQVIRYPFTGFTMVCSSMEKFEQQLIGYCTTKNFTKVDLSIVILRMCLQSKNSCISCVLFHGFALYP